jgi:hypothetical protein
MKRESATKSGRRVLKVTLTTSLGLMRICLTKTGPMTMIRVGNEYLWEGRFVP